MKRLFATAATVALAASLVATPPVSAGGWATVTVVGPSEAPVVGAAWPLELEVLQHGVTPIDWERVSMVARQPNTGTVASANAHAGDAVGRYLMDVVFPESGDWIVEFGLLALQVADESAITISVSATPNRIASRTLASDAVTSDA